MCDYIKDSIDVPCNDYNFLVINSEVRRTIWNR